MSQIPERARRDYNRRQTQMEMWDKQSDAWQNSAVRDYAERNPGHIVSPVEHGTITACHTQEGDTYVIKSGRSVSGLPQGVSVLCITRTDTPRNQTESEMVEHHVVCDSSEKRRLQSSGTEYTSLTVTDGTRVATAARTLLSKKTPDTVDSQPEIRVLRGTGKVLDENANLTDADWITHSDAKSASPASLPETDSPSVGNRADAPKPNAQLDTVPDQLVERVYTAIKVCDDATDTDTQTTRGEAHAQYEILFGSLRQNKWDAAVETLLRHGRVFEPSDASLKPI